MFENLYKIIDFTLHIDKYLKEIVNNSPYMSYFIIFLIIFIETGIVIMPFLPGDSLLFTAGAIAGIGGLDIYIIFIIIFTGAVLGDAMNYSIGKYFGPKIFAKESSFFFKKEYLLKTQSFYEKHGKKTIILARFLPIIRTFAPFVAGVGKMPYHIFFLYNVTGAFLWCFIFILGGYLFGNLEIVQKNFGIFVIFIILLSISPIFYELIKYFLKKRKIK